MSDSADLTFAIVIATYGDQYWADLAQERAVASAQMQGAEEFIVRHDPNGQRHLIRNQAAAEATADYLAFVDADDHLAPGYIDGLRKAAPTDGTVALLNPSVGHFHQPSNHACFAPKPLHMGNYMIIGTAVPRLLFEQVGGFWDWPGFEDWELWIRCEKAGATVIQVPDAVYLIDSTERSRDARAKPAETGRWLRQIRQHHYPEIYGPSARPAPVRCKRSVRG